MEATWHTFMSLPSLVLILFSEVTQSKSHTFSLWQLFTPSVIYIIFCLSTWPLLEWCPSWSKRANIINLLSMFLCVQSLPSKLSLLLLPYFSSPNWITFYWFKFKCYICIWASAATCPVPCSPLLVITCPTFLSHLSSHFVFKPVVLVGSPVTGQLVTKNPLRFSASLFSLFQTILSLEGPPTSPSVFKWDSFTS